MQRRWTPDAEEFLTHAGIPDEALFDKKLKSPAQMEKSLGKELFNRPAIQGRIVRSEGAPKLVPESDKRQPLLLERAADIYEAVT